jgi:hypothetical protein
MAPDGSRAILAGVPSAVYDLSRGTELFAIPGGPSPGGFTLAVPTTDLTKAIVIANSYDRRSKGSAAVWDLITPSKLGEVELEATTGAVPAAALSPEGTRLIVAAFTAPGAPPGTPKPITPKLVITAWDLKTGKQLSQTDDVTMRWTGQMQMAAADETTAIISGGAGKLRRYDYVRGKFGEDFEPVAGGYETPSPIVFNPDRTRFAVGVAASEAGLNGVRIHEWPSGKVLHTFKGHPSQITALTFSADGKRLASGSFDSTVLVWDMEAVKGKE